VLKQCNQSPRARRGEAGRRSAGFSLVEVLVAVGLLSIVLMFVFNSFSYQNATHHVVDQVSEIQQSARAITRLMERDIRNAGYLVPPGAAACGVDSTTAPDMLFVSDADAILPADQLALEYAGKDLGGETNNDPASTGATTIIVDSAVIDGVATYDVDNDGTNDSDFRVGAGAILVDRGNPERGVGCGLVTNVNPTSRAVSVNMLAVHNTTAAGAKDLFLVPANVYRIVSPAGDPPRMERNGEMLAKDVEDMQIAYFFDDDDDDVIDAGETRADGTTAYANSAINGENLREIRLNLVLATRTNDTRNPDDAGIGQARENRTVASAPGVDGKHRRAQTTTVRLRNLSL
jgi:prepilin-type N-terminal cleavage/methylation domain-containing protein